MEGLCLHEGGGQDNPDNLLVILTFSSLFTLLSVAQKNRSENNQGCFPAPPHGKILPCAKLHRFISVIQPMIC